VYRIEISHIAHKQIESLPLRLAQRINEAIAELANKPCPDGAKKLMGIEGYGIRVGDYRILLCSKRCISLDNSIQGEAPQGSL